jgi:hypothetical protein
VDKHINNIKKLIRIYIVIPVMLVATLLISCSQGANTNGRSGSAEVSTSDTAKISFKEYEHNFGRVTAGEKVACIFTFQNTGTAPLVISSATTSCDCTVSKYDKKPVLPGKSGIIEAVFDSSGRNGKQTKIVTIQSNASKPIVLLKITGEVISSTNN